MRLTAAAILVSVMGLPAMSATAKREQALEMYNEAVEQQRQLDGLTDAERTPAAYQKLVNAFRRVYRTSPQSSRADDSIAAEAELYQEMSRRFGPDPWARKASESWRFLIDQYPRSPLLADARKKLEELQQPAATTTPETPKSTLPLVTEVRHWSQPELTRVIVTLEAEVQVKPERLANPDRIFFDIPNTKLHASLKSKVVPVGDDRVRQIRVAQTQVGVTRVVVDLAADADFTLSSLSNPPRLVMELKARRPENPLLAKAELPKSEPPVKRPVPRAAEPPAPITQPPTPITQSKPAKLQGREQNLIRALGLKISRVVIDAGHGGHDTGTIGPTGLTEKELALDVATRLGALVSDRIGSEVIFTRAEDVFIPLEERTALANEKQADLFVSVHANSSRLAAARGIETYYLNLTADREALQVAARENAASNKSIHDLQDLVTRITLTEKIAESREFAGQIQRSLYATMARDNGTLRNRGVRKAPFVVLIGARMPSILAEISFLSNPRDEKLLKTAAYRQKIAEALFSGIASYARTLSRVEVASRD